MRLFIAEKPTLGRAIADGLGVKKRAKGYIECNNGDYVTWVFGHFFELAPPDAYDEKYKKWSFDTLPIIPSKFKRLLHNDKGKKIQFNVIKKLITQCDSIVNAGDPDREGQLLVDELLEEVNNKKSVERIWLASLDLTSTKKALKEIKSNTDPQYVNMKWSAQARSAADWLYGMNLTRAMTLIMQKQGGHTVLSIGRVQTPTLAIIVDRENTILNFKPKDYFICHVDVKNKDGNAVTVNYLPENNNNLGGDSEGYLVQKDIVNKVVDAIKKGSTVEEYNVDKKSTKQPLVYNLSTLQSDASSKLGFGAQQTLDVAQKLYEKKVTSYPRSDCRYLPEEQLSEAEEKLKMLCNIFSIASKANVDIKSPVWNTKKIKAHHGIIPTNETPNNLTDDEIKLYSLVAKRYIAQFFPPEIYEAISLLVKDSEGYIWKANGKRVLSLGWRSIYEKNAEDKEGNQEIPKFNKGELLTFIKEEIKDAKTKPPARFTEGTLIKAMENISNFVMNPQYKKILKTTSGLGTEATRAGIIETLFKRKYIKKKGKNLIPTDLGSSLINGLSPKLKDPGVTAVWEEYLKAIEEGKMNYDDFIGEQKKFIPKYIESIKETKFPEKVIKMFPSKFKKDMKR